MDKWQVVCLETMPPQWVICTTDNGVNRGETVESCGTDRQLAERVVRLHNIAVEEYRIGIRIDEASR